MDSDTEGRVHIPASGVDSGDELEAEDPVTLVHTFGPETGRSEPMPLALVLPVVAPGAGSPATLEHAPGFEPGLIHQGLPEAAHPEVAPVTGVAHQGLPEAAHPEAAPVTGVAHQGLPEAAHPEAAPVTGVAGGGAPRSGP